MEDSRYATRSFQVGRKRVHIGDRFAIIENDGQFKVVHSGQNETFSGVFMGIVSADSCAAAKWMLTPAPKRAIGDS